MKARRQRGHTTLDLLEESVHLLRTSPASALGWYYAGALPFVLLLLFFWSDMSWSADARSDCAIDAVFVALGFLWMKFAQSMSADKMRSQLKVDPDDERGGRRIWRVAMQQTILQPSKLFLLPVALIVTLPFGWVFAFYENVTAFGASETLGRLWSRAQAQARLWPRQNHLALSIFLLVGLVMGINLLLICFLAPHLVKMLTGVETVFTRSGMHYLNSTVLAVAGSATYLCCDPLVKAFYVLRCFYGESLQSGEDLRAELRRVRRGPALVATVLIALFSLGGLPATNAAPAPAALSARVDAQRLDRAIEETISEPQFRWRMPREEVREDDSRKANAFDRFLKRLGQRIGKWWKKVTDWLDRIQPHPRLPNGGLSGAGDVSRSALELTLIVLSVILVVLIAIKTREYFRQRNAQPRKKIAGKLAVDVSQEHVTADQLPEDEWLQLARKLMQEGDWRLALRAFFLAGLAHLSQREVIALARYKSNRDYQNEVRRRAPAQVALQEAFTSNLRDVERAWYGRHDVTAEGLELFQRNLDTIRAK